MNIIPKPREVQIIKNGINKINTFKILTPNSDFDFFIEYCSSFIKISDNAKNTIEIIIDCSLKKEEYYIKTDDNIIITASTREGVFRAAATLKQILSNNTLDSMIIHDFPMIQNRGIMLDISRGKIPTFDGLKKLINILSDLKYNQLQLYMDGPVFEYKHYEDFCSDKTPLTIDELKEIIKYAKKRFITPVPNQNSFGHMEKWLKNPKLRDLGIKIEGQEPNTLNPFNEKSIEFVDTLYSDLLPYFDTDIVNVGMDEPFSLGEGNTKKECEKLGKENVYLEYLNKIFKLITEKYNKTPMFWDDIIFEKPDLIPSLNRDSIVMDWGYEADMNFTTRAKFLSENNFRFYMCPGTSMWASFTGRFDNMIYNIEGMAKACILYNAEGFLLTDWGDGGNAQFPPFSYLPYIFGSCCSWNYENFNKDSTEFNHLAFAKETDIIERCEQYADKFLFNNHKVANCLHKMANYYLAENNICWIGTNVFTDIEKILNSDVPNLTISDSNLVIIYMNYLLDEFMKNDKSTPYFEEIICNCEMVILSAKFIKEWLMSNGKINNSTLKSELKELREKFFKLWLKESKPYGCDVFGDTLLKMINKTGE